MPSVPNTQLYSSSWRRVAAVATEEDFAAQAVGVDFRRRESNSLVEVLQPAGVEIIRREESHHAVVAGSRHVSALIIQLGQLGEALLPA